MISLVRNTIKLGDKEELIIGWSVAFRTPFGLVSNLDEALMIVNAKGLDPELAIIPQVIVTSENLYEAFG